MRFSDIQDNPLNYNLNTILEELENYFTVYVHRYPFISYINTDQLTLTLHEETLSPTDVIVHFKDDPILKPDFKKAYIPKNQLKGLFFNTISNETKIDIKSDSFSKEFLQKLICNTAPIKEFRELLHDAIANKALENITNSTSNELNAMFNAYFEDNLLDFNITYKLNFKYRFLDTRRIELTRYEEKFELVKSELTNKWMLNEELSEHLLEKFTQDCAIIKNLIQEQPTTLECVLNRQLGPELIPYLNTINYINTKMTAHKRGPKWIVDNNYVDIIHDNDYVIRAYQLNLELPIQLTYNDEEQIIVTFPITPGESLKPAQQVIDSLESSVYYWDPIKKQLAHNYVKSLVTDAIVPKRKVIKQLIFSSDNKVLRFKEDNIEYCLTIRGDEVTYECDGNRQLTFLKKENDFDISLQYSSLLYEKFQVVKNPIHELIDKI